VSAARVFPQQHGCHKTLPSGLLLIGVTERELYANERETPAEEGSIDGEVVTARGEQPRFIKEFFLFSLFFVPLLFQKVLSFILNCLLK
jgi:hypothetical protein